MAKKNLAALMNGIMGEAAPSTENTDRQPVQEDVVKAPENPVSSPVQVTQEAQVAAVASYAESEKENNFKEPETTSAQNQEEAETATISNDIATPAPRRRVGRPRKGETPVKTEEIRATFIVDPSLVRKMKYISLVEGNLLKDVIGVALENYISQWEAENGKIRLPKTK